ncbi:MAG: ion transporter [Phycisphaerales bacterium]|nr:ion transporter [Phycisphaerales bacterium]
MNITKREIDFISRHQPKAYDLFLAVIAIVALGLAAWQLFLPPEGELRKLLIIFDYVFCLLFFIDYIHQIVIADRKWKYIFTWGLFDLASSIPLVGPLRVLRFARIFRVLRAIRSLRILSQVLVRDRLASAVSMLMMVGTLIIIGSCVGVLQYESQAPDSTIKTAQDVAWWAVVTTSTVGYGDMYPITPEGRLLAVLIMSVGIGLFATFAGALAGMFMRKPKHADTPAPISPQERFDALHEQNQAILERLRSLEDELRKLRDETPPEAS